jgi:ABC-2 type transport system permease protein
MGAMVRKEFAQLRRDRRTVAMLVVIPLLLLLMFGYAARFEVDSARTAVLGPGAATAVESLPEVFDVREVDPDGDRAAAVELLREADIDAAVVLPDQQILVDGTQLFAAQAVRQVAVAAGQPVEVLFNPDLDTATVMVPGLVGLIMLFIGALATSLGVVRERQAGTMEQLAVMPFSPRDLFVGKLAPYLAIAVVDLLVIVGVGLALFEVPFEGSPWTFAAGATIFLFVALSIGVLISTVSENQGQAVQLALMVLLPQIMLSGLIFPVEAMGEVLGAVATVLPLTWFVELARGVMVAGADLAQVATPLLVLGGMAVVVSTLAVLRFGALLAPAGRAS